MILSQYLSDHVCHCFATVDMIKKILITAASNNIRHAAESMLKLYCGSNKFMCDEHSEWGITQANRVIVNIFFNNEQQVKNNTIRKEAIKSFRSRRTMKRKYKEN